MANPTVQYAARITEKMHSDLARLAAREGTSMNHEINIAIRAHLDADRRRRAA